MTVGQSSRDVPEERADLTIDVDTVRLLIQKIRALNAELDSDYEDGHEHDIEYDPVTHSDRHAHDGLAEEESDDYSDQELRELIGDFNSDEAADLVALTWIGRGDFTGDDWQAARREAKERAEGPTERYLLGMPLLGDYLEMGLAAIGR